jgi:uncharacterized membrane protein
MTSNILNKKQFARRKPDLSLRAKNFLHSASSLFFRLLTMIVFGAAIHICIILLLPHYSQGDAWSRLENISRPNQLAILPSAGAGKTSPDSRREPLAFMAPDVRYAICRYDLSEGPLQLVAPMPDALWSIALYTRQGQNYYLVSGRNVQSRRVNLLVVREEDGGARDNTDNNAGGDDELREVTVSAPGSSGIIVIRAPIPTPAQEQRIARQLATAFCRPVSFASPGKEDRAGK